MTYLDGHPAQMAPCKNMRSEHSFLIPQDASTILAAGPFLAMASLLHVKKVGPLLQHPPCSLDIFLFPSCYLFQGRVEGGFPLFSDVATKLWQVVLCVTSPQQLLNCCSTAVVVCH